MEAVEESALQKIAAEAVKVNIVSCEANAEANASVQSDVCQKSNGVADLKESARAQPSADDYETPAEVNPSETIVKGENSTEDITAEQDTTVTEIAQNENITTTSDEVVEPTEDEAVGEPTDNEKQQFTDLEMKTDNNEEMEAGDVELDGIVDASSENVRFETEILIETNVDDQSNNYKIIYSDVDSDQANNILSELGQNIELSEVLRSSDVADNAENNNCEVRQEVFNKEELLDILEGNDIEESRKVVSGNFITDCKKLETQLALQQLSRLKTSRKPKHTPSKKTDKKSSKKSESPKDESVKKKSSSQKEDSSSQTKSESMKDESAKKKNSSQKEENSQANSDSTTEPKEESIVNALVKDWEDDEHSEEQPNTLVEEIENLSEESEGPIKEALNESKMSNADTSISDGQASNVNLSGSETQPQRRLGRVIKKKVIFDPDNPDTFTKTKVAIKKENQSEKDQKDHPIPKKVKTDPSSPRSKSKSPVQSKLQWKKPQPKNIKQNKRLTEIDRLLMDEGAVNMICQLTPEAPKGHKNMKSKAEFIKKIQSSNTPEGKEMKFRERKLKSEEGDAKRIGSGKERLSLSSSVKSPTVSEDFEAHSADDSIIYRRHSSSSYSSPCMSPRRLSDVETINQAALASKLPAASDGQVQPQAEEKSATGSDLFMAEGTLATGVLNKSDFLSIKEKLNSKLSQALNKRKRDSTKGEKPSKIKKVTKSTEKPATVGEYKYVKLITDHKLAEICIQSAGSIYDVEVMNELKCVLKDVESKNDICVTLMTSEFGTLYSGLELRPLIDQEKGPSYAQELAESVRSLLCALEGHSKLLCAAVEGRCHGLGLSLVALSDVTVASEMATFELSLHKDAPLQPGAGALTTIGLPHSLLNDMIVFGRAIPAAEALRGGLLSRTVWPPSSMEQARIIAKQISSQPAENIILKKHLLRRQRGGSESFLACVERERDLFVKYWTSAEGRELVRASLESAKE